MAKKRGNNEGTIVKRTDGRWMAVASVGRDLQTGRLKRVAMYGRTRQEVADKLAKTLHDKAQGTFVEPNKLTMGQWLDTWLWTYKKPKLRPTTLDTYASLVRLHLKPAFGRIPLRNLRPERIQHYLNEKAKQGLDACTIRLHHVVLSNALKQAEKNGLVARNVGRLVEAPRQMRKERPTLTLEQVRSQLLLAIEGDRLYAAFLTFFMTGLRKGELLALRWQDVELEAGTLQVRQSLARVGTHTANAGERKTQIVKQAPKTKESQRTVSIPAECLAALKRHKARQAEEKLLLGQAYQDHGLVFCREDGMPIDPRTIGRHFTQALKQAGLPSIRLHDARHTYATWMLEQGVPMKTVQVLLGHSSFKVTADIYSHVSPELAKEAADTLNAAFTTKG